MTDRYDHVGRRSPPRRRYRSDDRGLSAPDAHSEIIRVPTNLSAETRELIDLVASFVARGGIPLERDIVRLQTGNPNFDFIDAPLSDPANVYYRWRLYSLLQGDSLTRWRTEAFQVTSEGSRWWIPPPSANQPSSLVKNAHLYATITSHGLNADSLPLADRDKWFDLLSHLTTPDRDSICDAMVFAVERSVYAYDLLDTLVDAVGFVDGAGLAADLVRPKPGTLQRIATESETATLTQLTRRMISRLFLLSDILCNVFATVHGATASPRSIIKAADFAIPRLLAEFMTLAVLVAEARNGDTVDWSHVVFEADSMVGQLIGWMRELWALWQAKGVVSPHLTDLVKAHFSFILAPTV